MSFVGAVPDGVKGAVLQEALGVWNAMSIFGGIIVRLPCPRHLSIGSDATVREVSHYRRWARQSCNKVRMVFLNILKFGLELEFEGLCGFTSSVMGN